MDQVKGGLKTNVFLDSSRKGAVVTEVQKSASHYTEAAEDEVEILTHIVPPLGLEGLMRRIL